MQKALGHTVIIDFSHYAQLKLLSWWFKSGVFEPHFGAYSRRERRYSYIKGCNSNAFQKIVWKQIVTCLPHSKKHFKTNLAEYWRGVGVQGRSSYLPDYTVTCCVMAAFPKPSLRAPWKVRDVAVSREYAGLTTSEWTPLPMPEFL